MILYLLCYTQLHVIYGWLLSKQQEPLRWGKRQATPLLRWGKRSQDPLRWGKRQALVSFWAPFWTSKGQLISKCIFCVFKSQKKNKKKTTTTKFFVRISALASKKRSNQEGSVRESK